mmetsp:Transcript_8739/g.21316  ORF Transcript_8739/g.21316 Transcript_8739/m.21316 type:complete len:474 (-) Transcript_8739:49-1470(-)
MANRRLDEYNQRYHNSGQIDGDDDDDDDDDEYSIEYSDNEIIAAMAVRSYHLPSYSSCADWVQYFRNTHPLFGMCCHHPLHPVKWPMRLLHLLGSIVFGLLVTNLIWLFMVYENERDTDRAVVTIDVGALNETKLGQVIPLGNLTSSNSESGDGTTEIEITEGMIFLWTVGGTLHALFDNTIWYLVACVCCLPGQALEKCARLKRYGVIMLVFTIIAVGALSSFMVVLRATLADNEDAEPSETGFEEDETNPLTDWEDKSSFQFLLSYIVEVFLAMVFYYPLVGTVLFSGILGCCGRVPVLGGRPYELAQEEKRKRRQVAKNARRARKSASSPQNQSHEEDTYVSNSTLSHVRNNSASSSEDLNPHRPLDYALQQQNGRDREVQSSSSPKRTRKSQKQPRKQRDDEPSYNIARSVPKHDRFDEDCSCRDDDYDEEAGIRVSSSSSRGKRDQKSKKAKSSNDEGIRVFSGSGDK